MPITRTVLAMAAEHPDEPAIVAPDGQLTYAELVDNSRRMFTVVDALHRAQLTPPPTAPETRGIPITAVSLASTFHTARIVAGLAGFRAVSATIDPNWPLEHRAGVILATGIGVVISDATDFAAALDAHDWTGTFLTLSDFLRKEADATPADGPAVRDDDEPFLLLFSSGSTSNPKAFMKTRRQYRASVAISSAHLDPKPGTATLAPGPVSYSLTLYALIESLASGGSAHLADTFDPVQLGHRIQDEKITRVVAVPAVVQALVDAARRSADHFELLELVVTGGANLPAILRTGLADVLPHVRLISYYGTAEIGFIGDSRAGDGTRVSIYEGIGVSIRDDRGSEVPAEAPGTLWVQGAGCSDAYLAGTTDATLTGPDGWATVHDQARLVDGVLVLAGRAGDIAVTGGHKVTLPDVERAFEGMLRLGAICAVALPHERLGTVIALIVEGSGPGKGRLQERARENLAPQFVPRRWYRVDRLPRTVGGKIRRGAAAELVARGEVERL